MTTEAATLAIRLYSGRARDDSAVNTSRAGMAMALPIARHTPIPIDWSQPGPAISGSRVGVTAARPMKTGAIASEA